MIKLLLAAMTIVTVGTIILPSTVSLFAGQHDWYTIDTEGNDVPCEKCHADVYEELKNNPYHENFTCAMCHRAIATGYASGNVNGETSTGSEWGAHAASTIGCLACHGGLKDTTVDSHAHVEISGELNKMGGSCSNTCHVDISGPPKAGGFGLTGESWDTGTYAAHRQFVLDAKNDSLMDSANEACIACHTHVAVRINWTHASSLELNVTLIMGKWTTENYNANGSVNTTVWGNAEGTGGIAYNGTTTTTWGTGGWP
ncbi:hypothetical protein [Geoglobus acetivorans]|uniref:Multiheme cytochrome c n=1 Tax=Geoglobus acetivorans TaxID=565033 RepID=A0ABZ3H3E4_GEOAI|nr:hypothetical protein [Geoglobus acetivorans]